MAKATRSKSKTTAANVSVPQSREEAAAAVARIGELNREFGRIAAYMNDKMAAIKADHEARSAPLAVEAARLTDGVKIWAEANRSEITNQRMTKTVDLATGTISWRFAPPKVTGIPRGKEDLAALIETIRAMGFRRFIRTEEKISREAMLADPEKAKTIPGIKIGTAGEDFIVEPFEVELSAEGGAS